MASVSPLTQAYFALQEAANDGFDWSSPFEAAAKVQEELQEVIEELHKSSPSHHNQAVTEEIGDLFLACVCLARKCNIDPDEAIELGLKKFTKRYARFQKYLQERGISLRELSREDLLKLWNLLKEEKDHLR